MTSRLREIHPELAPDQGPLLKCQDLLRRAYEDYTSHVSPAQMAISLESATYLFFLAMTTRPKSVCDFGSGFTSYVLRRYAAVRPDVTVTSVDDMPEWLGWTESFLARQGMPVAGLVEWETYEKDPTGPHDLIVYDFGGGTFREEHMGLALDLLARDGLILFDDAQHFTHQRKMLEECSARKYDLFDAGEWTKDNAGRFAALGVRWT